MSSHLNPARAALLLLPLAACAPPGSGVHDSRARRGEPLIVNSADAVLSTARRYLGVKYVWGGESPRTGFDCSGFTQYVFARHGIRIPRTSRAQVSAGTAVPVRLSALEPGDLIMFANPGRAISHVAIYAGNSRIIHASGSGGGVRYDDLRSRRGAWYRNNMVAVRRIGHVLASSRGRPDGYDAPRLTDDVIVRDFVRELRRAGVRVDFPFDLGDFAASAIRNR